MHSRLTKSRILNKAAIAAWCSLGTVCGYAATTACKSPDAQKQRDLSAYIIKQYHLPSTAQVSVVDGGQANDSCFWKLSFEIASPKREIALYLSPDGEFLAPTLYDVRIDPLVEERRAAALLSKELLADDPPARGPKDAPVTIVEFSDFQCPFCKRFTDSISQLPPEDKARVRVVFHQYPLAMHPWAKNAAEVAECAALQNPEAFWKVHDYLFANQQAMKADTVRETVAEFAISSAGVEKAQFQTCMDRKLSAGPVEVDMDLGNRNNVHATPTFFVNGVRYEGAKDVSQLRAIIAEQETVARADRRIMNGGTVAAK